MKNYYVYAHFTVDSNELFYIGKGTKNRAHSDRGRNKYWHNIVNKHGYKVIILINNLTEESSLIQEFLGIKQLKPKANLTKGGTGGNTTAFYSKQDLEKKRVKCSRKRQLFWKNKDNKEKNEILKNAHKAVSKMWSDMDPVQKSNEQKRRSNMRSLKAVKCLNNGKIYKSAKQAGEALKLPNAKSINRVAKGDRPHYKNFKFKYVTSK